MCCLQQHAYKGFLTPCRAGKSSQFETAAYQVRIWGAVKIFPHEALKVMESQDQRLHGVHQKHWQEYQALHCLAQRGNASTLTCQRKSQKKGLWMLQNWVSKREGLSTHCCNNETSFNTHRAWGIHSGMRRSVEKRALYLKQKILNSTQGNKLGWHAWLVHSDKKKNDSVSALGWKQIMFLGALMDKIR